MFKELLGEFVCRTGHQAAAELRQFATDLNLGRIPQQRSAILFFKFDVSQFLKSNFKELLEALEKATGGSILLREESRAMLELNPANDEDFLSRSTGEPLGSESAPENTASKQMEKIENRLQKLLMNATQSIAKTESSKLASAVDRDDFGEWLTNFYGREWRARLEDGQLTAQVTFVEKSADDDSS